MRLESNGEQRAIQGSVYRTAVELHRTAERTGKQWLLAFSTVVGQAKGRKCFTEIAGGHDIQAARLEIETWNFDMMEPSQVQLHLN